MKFEIAKLSGAVTQVLGIAIAWLALAELNAWIFSDLEQSPNAHWIFLPAAFRPLVILMFGRTGAAGLVLGAFLTVYGTTGGGPLHEVIFSVILGVTPWIAVSAGKWMMDIPHNLAGLGPRHIILLCTLCASANAVMLNGYLWATGRLEGGGTQILAVFVGDLLGAALLLLIISTALALAFPSRSRG
ncbi:MAG: hypothetical protein O9293_14220 [Porphyrobacter sp.]|nr:hypothetical protein [Porphyrobacter sp.]